MVSVVMPVIIAKEQVLDLTGLEPVPLTSIDPSRVEQVLLNLLNNANRYTPAGGNITLRLHQQDDRIVLSVQDTCGGLLLGDPTQIFEAYYRPRHKASTAPTSGSGLGLAIAKGLVEQHGGELQVESIRGQGCTFSVSLPMQLEPAMLEPGTHSLSL